MKHYGFDNYSECAEYYLANPAKKFKRGGVNTGAKGCIFECVVRHAVNGIWEHVHVMDETDVTIKRGVTLECKSGAGDLTSARWSSREQAAEVWESSKRPMRKASQVCYTVKVNVENPAEMLETARVFTQNEFIQILEESKMLRFRKDGEKFCAAIQTVSESTAKSQFLKNGQPRKETAPNKFRRLILERGETLESFIERMTK